jgi:putative ABC transport system ATP-binding protein
MMITLKNLHKSYITGSNSLHVLKGLNMEIEEGEMVSVMGASGSGKSTLLNVLGILDNYDSGDYYLNGMLIRDINETKAAQLRNRTLGFVFQSFNLISFKNALENVALPLYYQGVHRRKRNQIAMEYLDRVGLKLVDSPVSELSGGRNNALPLPDPDFKPKVILADEHGALDSVTSMEVMDLMQEINEEE